MPPIVIDLQTSEDPNDGVHLAVEFLAAGKIVALPTESTYEIAASALNREAAQRICEIQRHTSKWSHSLAVKSDGDALDYVPDLSAVGSRLVRRCWPGPLGLLLDATHPDSLLTQVPESVRAILVEDGQVTLKVPDHPVFRHISRLSIGPMILSTARSTEQQPCLDGNTVVQTLGDQVDLILDDGSTRYGQESSVVQLEGNRYSILREGVLGRVALKRMSSFLALMVCTGNTCRSPMAEVLFKKHFADKMGCEIDELEDKGVVVASAGVAAMPGSTASQESIDVIEKMGLDLSQHESQPVSDQLLESADLILTMTRGHREAIIAHWPDIADRVHVLSLDGGDVSDPFGGSPEIYESCANQIDNYVKEWVNKTDFGIPE